jgi:Domain of unknown function (DUF4138)
MLRSFLFLFVVLLIYLRLPAQVVGKAGLGEQVLLSPFALKQSAKRVLALPDRYHDRTQDREIQLTLKQVAIDSVLLWIHCTLYNRSHIKFHPAYVRIFVRNLHRSKRTAAQSVEITPYRRPLLGIVGYRHSYELLIPFVPFTVGNREQLQLQIGEASGGRQLQLPISGRKLLAATYLP